MVWEYRFQRYKLCPFSADNDAAQDFGVEGINREEESTDQEEADCAKETERKQDGYSNRLENYTQCI